MPRGVLQGEPEVLGVPPYDRRPGDPCLVLMRAPDTGDVVPAAMRWGIPTPSDPRRPVLQVPVERMRGRRMARRGRCLVAMDGYTQRGVKRTPIAVRVADGVSVAIAAVWEDGPGGPRFAIVTTEANELLAPAHARMPVLLPASMWPSWIAEGALTAADLALVERPAPPAWLRAQAVRGTQSRPSPLPVARQLADWAPGSRFWAPREQRTDLATSKLGAHPHALG
ncbi:SOS response-associated peptidase family protein [Falsiroseomonas oryzae]|uniref:SOS response-associated peptidase family protein n=1 Tax=Falsiroseomonas oryzae TaxID=2766473 RepID=UPI0022EAEA9E|nr:SOS response-associated peptidase family protein [Roseomonas sp. MO-31]